MITTVWPACSALVTPTNGPAWYIGPQTRCTPWSTVMPNPWHVAAAVVAATSSGSPSGSGRRTPLGWPVVPDVYIITAPGLRGGCGPAGHRLRSVKGRNPVDLADGEAVLGVDAGVGRRGAAHAAEILVADEHLRFRVRDHERGLRRGEVGIDGDEVEAALGRGQPGSEEGAVVRENGGDGVAPPHAERVEAVGDGSGVLEQFAVCEHAAVVIDDRDPIGIGGRDAPEAEPGGVHEKSEYCFSGWETTSATNCANASRSTIRGRHRRGARRAWRGSARGARPRSTTISPDPAGRASTAGWTSRSRSRSSTPRRSRARRVPGVPGTGVGIAGPTIIRHGTAEQKARWLRPMLRADVIWAQGYSEPEAGSDLPALRTTAVRDGDRYVVNGQKVWSSSADIADILFSLVRTGGPDSGRDGITYLLIDAHAPGVTVRPLRDMTGDSGFCEIFFDDVGVPVEHRIGEENHGWGITRTSLGHERAAGALTQARFYDRIVRELAALARASAVAPTTRSCGSGWPTSPARSGSCR